MQLFLTSSPCDDNVPDGAGLPCIFFERNSFVENLRRFVPGSFRFGVFAADPDAHALNDEMASTFAGCLAWHGMEPMETLVCDGRNAASAAEIVASCGVLLLGGGHVPTQHAFFERIGLREMLRGYGGVVMGVSAGSMNCASTVYAQPELPGEAVDPHYRRFLHGLELTNVMLLPHLQQERHTIIDGKRLYDDVTFSDSIGREFIAIPDGSYILADGGETRLFGEGWRVADGKMTCICGEGESLRL